MYSDKAKCSVKRLRYKPPRMHQTMWKRSISQFKMVAFVVSTNDLNHKSEQDVAESSKTLLNKAVTKHAAYLVLHEIPPRKYPDTTWKRGFEERRVRYNKI